MIILPSKKHIAVASGTIAAGDNKLDYTSTNAFIEFGVDLTSYHGNHKIVVTDSAGKSASGYLHSVAPGGEALGAELIINGDMELDSNWSDYGTPLINERSSVEVFAGSYSRKFSTNATFTGIESDPFTVAAGAVYSIGITDYPATSGTLYIGYFVTEGTGSGGKWEQVGNQTYDTWNSFTKYFTCSVSGDSSVLRINSATSAMERVWYVDNLTVKRLTDCAATGSLIVSTLGGATRSWTSVDTGFDPNLACAYKIYRVR